MFKGCLAGPVTRSHGLPSADVLPCRFERRGEATEDLAEAKEVGLLRHCDNSYFLAIPSHCVAFWTLWRGRLQETATLVCGPDATFSCFALIFGHCFSCNIKHD